MEELKERWRGADSLQSRGHTQSPEVSREALRVSTALGGSSRS